MGGVNDVIARGQLGQAVDFSTLVFAAPRFPAVRRDASVGDDGKAGLREIRPGRKSAPDNQDPAFERLVGRWRI